MKRLSVNRIINILELEYRIYQNELTKSKDIKYIYKRDAIEKVIYMLKELNNGLWLWTTRTIGLYRLFIVCR